MNHPNPPLPPQSPTPQQFAPPPPDKPRWYHRKLVAAGALFVAASIGFGLGSTETEAASEPTRSEPTTLADPEVVTKTETITEQVTPRSCLDALDAAEQVAQLSADFSDVAGGYIPLIAKAYQRGASLSGDVSDITARMNRLTERNDEINGELAGVVADYNAAAQRCRSAS